ncbi:polysaccharide export outer membrane protein [Paraburkholderia sp. GAS448]|uniref:polysaccharide biosynthesis/export family protein n=1 Tax=Paraburkholderia sp. GAS448 TaxID=3035136 RepID=UPI003D24D4DC
MLVAAFVRMIGRLGFLVMASLTLLSACGVAPGMRMNENPSLPIVEAGGGEASDALAVPISDINLALIQEMRKEAAARRAADGSPLFSTPEPYTLGVGDVLNITVWDHPELAAAQGAQSQPQVRPADAPAGFVIDQTGDISFPYAGTLRAAGLRTDELQADLARRLARVFQNPQVTVRIASFRARKVYVDGEVHTPGVQPINDIPMTLYEAITRAGGFTPAADQSRMLLTRKHVRYQVDLPKMLDHGLDPSRIVLKDGDLLRVVPRDENGVFVMGEITRPMTAVPQSTGKLTLSDALSQAGSVNAMTADASQMYVIRGDGERTPKVYHLDGSSPVSMVLANQFELQPKDVVYVDSTSLARFSRVLSQLLPLINAGLTGAVVAK